MNAIKRLTLVTIFILGVTSLAWGQIGKGPIGGGGGGTSGLATYTEPAGLEVLQRTGAGTVGTANVIISGPSAPRTVTLPDKNITACYKSRIDAHAGSTTITAADLASCNAATIHNASQAAADVNNTLPEAAASMGFTGVVSTTQGANYFRLTAASAGTIYLNGSATGKNYISYATPTVGQYFSCFTEDRAGTFVWYCADGVGSLTTN
jgi:hypothetical protein